MKKERRKNLTATILSLSLLTVMAGAAVAPALNVIKEYFSDVDQTLVQIIISVPALFIALTSIIFPRLCKVFKSKELLMAGLILYVCGGCVAGLFSNIFLVLIFRAFVGVGVGIIMPMSTGLLSFYYTRDKQDRLMGYASAMNQLGGVIATLIAGVLATISWRASFLVYLIGLICIVLCLLFLPNEKIGSDKRHKENGAFKKYYSFVVAIFLLMFTFFIYPTSFAIEIAKAGIIPMQYVAVIMAGSDLVAFGGGLAFAHIKRSFGMRVKYFAPAIFIIGYWALHFIGGWTGVLMGSVFVGFANGLGIPFIMASAGKSAGRAAAVTVMPMLSMSMYVAQFITPMILSLFECSPYLVAVISSLLFMIWSISIKETETGKETVRQEK